MTGRSTGEVEWGAVFLCCISSDLSLCISSLDLDYSLACVFNAISGSIAVPNGVQTL